MTIGWETSNESVARAEWVNWVNHYNTELYLHGLVCGATTITTSCLGGTGGKNPSAEITVSVIA